MKKSKLIIYFVLTVILVVALSACKPDEGGHDSGKATEGYKDMNGQEFVFIGAVIPKNERDYTEDDYKNLSGTTLTLQQEAMFDHALVVEKNLNCTIVMEGNANGDSANFAAGFAAGEIKADFFYGQIDFARQLYVSDVVAPVSSLEALDATDHEKWGNEEMMLSTSYKGELFGFPCVGSNYYPYPAEYYGALLCKNDLYESFGLDTTPREMIEDGKWTFSEFKNMLPQLTSFDGETRTWSFIYSGLPYASVYANGGNIVVFKNGKYSFGYTRQNAITALEWAKSIYRTEGTSDGSHEGATMQAFIDGRCVFYLISGYRIFKEISAGTADYSWLPFPYGPDAEYGKTYSAYSTYADGIVCVFKNASEQRTQDSAYVMNELFEPTEYFGKDGYDDYLYRYYFDDGDEESFAVYKSQAENRHYDYSLELASVWSDFGSAVGYSMTSSGSVANYMASVEDVINDALDKNMNVEK